MTDSQNQTDSVSASENPAKQPGFPSPSGGGPINLEQIRLMREAQQTRIQQDQKRQNREKQPTKSRPPKDATGQPAPTTDTVNTLEAAPERIDAESQSPRYRSNNDTTPLPSKIPVPSVRIRNSAEEQMALDAELDGADLDGLMIGDRMLRVGRSLEDGSRHQGKVIKVHNANVFISLGGPDEGVVPLLQFETPPVEGQAVDCLIRAFNQEEGLYDLAIPGETVAKITKLGGRDFTWVT